jgi:hypothetical protein
VPPERPDIPNYAGVLDRGEIQEMKELYLEETRIYNEGTRIHQCHQEAHGRGHPQSPPRPIE